MARNHDDDPVIDANTVVGWAARGALTGMAVVAFLAVTDELGWPFWLKALVALPLGAAVGAASGALRRLLARRNATERARAD